MIFFGVIKSPIQTNFLLDFQASILKVWSPCQWLQFLAPLVTLLMLFPMKELAELTFRPSWLSIAPESGDILSGESLDLEVTFDAAGLYGGEYEATIEVYSNDPETQQVDIPVLLTVTGAADITVSDEVVEFGTLYTNYGGFQEIIIGNEGTDVLEISRRT